MATRDVNGCSEDRSEWREGGQVREDKGRTTGGGQREERKGRGDK